MLENKIIDPQGTNVVKIFVPNTLGTQDVASLPDISGKANLNLSRGAHRVVVIILLPVILNLLGNITFLTYCKL